MLGFTKIGLIALLIGMAFPSKAQEIEEAVKPPHVEVIPIDTPGEVEVIVVEELPPLQKDPVSTLLENAQRENTKRSNMRTAHLTETECLATAMYHEARGEGERGLLAVAFVIYNRVISARFPSNYCTVVRQRSQFSFITDRNPDNIKDWVMYAKILALAVELVQNDGFQRSKSPIGNALFFNSLRRVSSYNRFVATIGNHHFFK